MSSFTDQTGRTIILNKTPERIISLVPSQTELLYALGLDKEVVGITKFCVHPEQWFKSKTRIGGTKQVNIDLILQLKPDLIIANKEENVKAQVDELARHYPVWVSDVNNLEDAYEMIAQIGSLSGKTKEAGEMTAAIKTNFSQLTTCLPGRQASGPRLRTAYLIWQEPYMTVGGDTFIHSMLEAAGFENMFADKKRYPEITISDLLIDSEHQLKGCQLLLLSSEPFPFAQKHIDILKPYLPGTRIMLVDGEMFSWYGSRLIQAPCYFKRLLTMLNAES